MSVDILNMRRFDANDQAIDVALPVLAIECEATPPMENFLDAYEETVLKLISLGLSTGGISKTLNATESLVGEILTHLEIKEYAERKVGKPWILTEDGKKYLNGSIHERASAESKFGYMFINTIKKEVLPYFLEGDVGKISLFRSDQLPLRLTIEGDESQTFAPIEIKHTKLKKAYRAYFKNLKLVDEYDEGEISKEEAIDLFADLDSFEEEPEETNERAKEKGAVSVRKSTSLTRNMFIRNLEKKPIKLYLRMRIIIDPSYPGGYRAESPFDLGGIDNNFFLRQMQWMEQSEGAYLDGKVMQDFLHREICKLSPSYKNSAKDFQVFVLERMPLLKLYRSRMPYVYEDMERIYSLMQRQNSLLEKENIVNNLARCVVEGLFNTYFRDVDRSRLDQIQQKAFDDVDTYGYVTYKKRICRNAHLNEDTLQWVNAKYLKTILGRINRTYGNSIMEKFINMLVIEYHLSDAKMHKFLSQPNLDQIYGLIDKLNRIRRKVSHDIDDRFTNEDYEFYMAHVFGLINSLLEAFRED
ncbi:MAG: hypothetical protein ACI4FO_02435 [Acutalibacteraceae bacterium]